MRKMRNMDAQGTILLIDTYLSWWKGWVGEVYEMVCGLPRGSEKERLLKIMLRRAGGANIKMITEIAQLLPASEEKNFILDELIREYVNDGCLDAREIAWLRGRELTIAEWQAMLDVLIVGRQYRGFHDWAIAIKILKNHFPKVSERDITIRKFCERLISTGYTNYLEEVVAELPSQQERDEVFRCALEKEFGSSKSSFASYAGDLAAALSNQRERDGTLEKIFLRFFNQNNYEYAKKTAAFIIDVQKRDELLKKLFEKASEKLKEKVVEDPGWLSWWWSALKPEEIAILFSDRGDRVSAFKDIFSFAVRNKNREQMQKIASLLNAA